MIIPPIEFLTAANARRLSDPRVMGLDAYRHPYTDDAGAASVAQALARMPEHWKATPTCVAFSRLFAVDQTCNLNITADVHKALAPLKPPTALTARGHTSSAEPCTPDRMISSTDCRPTRASITVTMDRGLTWGSAAVIAKRLREIMDRQPPAPAQRDWYKLSDPRECGPGIAHVRGIEPRPVATVGYDDPTGDDVAADWRRS